MCTACICLVSAVPVPVPQNLKITDLFASTRKLKSKDNQPDNLRDQSEQKVTSLSHNETETQPQLVKTNIIVKNKPEVGRPCESDFLAQKLTMESTDNLPRPIIFPDTSQDSQDLAPGLTTEQVFNKELGGKLPDQDTRLANVEKYL